MRYIRIVGLLAVATALMGFAGTASGSTLTAPAGTAMSIGSTIEATSTNSKFHGSFITIECSHSGIKGTVQENATKGGNIASGSVGALTFTGCNYAVTINKGGSFSIEKHGTVLSTGLEIKLHTSVGPCIFTTSNTDVGVLTGSNTTGGHAVLDIASASIPRTGGAGFICGSSATWTGNYTVTNPKYLAVH